MLNLLLTIIAAVSAATAQPFWKAKSKVYERIQNGEVIVSVREESIGVDGRHHLVLSGGGQVDAPCAFVQKTAMNFEEIASLSGYIHDPKYDAASHTLEFTISAFFHSSTLKVKIESAAEPPPAHIDSTILTGPMKGFFYRLSLDPVAAAKCEVGISGNFDYETFPIHRLFLEFGLEAVFQNMAKRLRSQVESRYQKGGAPGHNPVDKLK